MSNKLRCPLCYTSFQETDKSYICQKNHCYDKAKQGYVNFIPQMKQSLEYHKQTFLDRRFILECGFYNHILNGIQNSLRHMVSVKTILDSGCGEGYYARELSSEYTVYACDISKASVQMAAKEDKCRLVNWCVADLVNLPLKDKAIDVILNNYAPANYGEFKRVLSDEGYVIKVIPNQEHVKELRELLHFPMYENQALIDLFFEHFDKVDCFSLNQTFHLNEQEAKAFIQMTPLLFSVDKKDLTIGKLTQLTIGGDVLIGKQKHA